jgi:predicted short-subunit dehydrogenase-like oxidoreductase (DUF2520 family)
MPAERAGRLGVGTIGAGRVGAVLAAALAGAGHALTGIAAVSTSSRERAAAMLPAVPVLPIPDIVERSELVLLAVPESELEGLVGGLADEAVERAASDTSHHWGAVPLTAQANAAQTTFAPAAPPATGESTDAR